MGSVILQSAPELRAENSDPAACDVVDFSMFLAPFSGQRTGLQKVTYKGLTVYLALDDCTFKVSQINIIDGGRTN